MNDLRDISDFLNAVAEAIREGDLDKLDATENQVREWLQTDDEKAAQINLLRSAYEAVEEANCAG
jgi:hypothetical protein